MIQGLIDFSRLAADASLPTEALNREGRLELPGLSLEARGGASLTHARSLLLVFGRPHALRPDDALAAALHAGDYAPLLEALRHAPAAVLNRLAGRYALCWLDLEHRCAGLASDRFATYPLCHARQGSVLSFADRADRVPQRSGGTRALDPQALYDYLYFHMIPAPRTVFAGVERLPPGSLLHADAQDTGVRPWWAPRFEADARPDFSRAKDEFLAIVDAAVAREAAAGPVGCFLSGGTDSSTVTGLLARHQAQPLAYSIGFEAEGYDEMEYARIAARHFGARHRAYYLTPQDLVRGIPQVAAHYDQPFGNSSALPAYYCARMAREDGLTRLLAGDGGDELFGGNTRYAKQRVFGWYDKLPGALRGGLLEPLLAQGVIARLPLARKAASYVEQARVPMPDRSEQYNLLLRLNPQQVLSAALRAASDPATPLALQRSVWQTLQASDLTNRMLGFDWRFTLADNDLPKVIGSTALAGVDVGFPLLADELVDFSLRLPPHYKLRGLKLRWFFKRALADLLPEAILTKQKHGFGLPFGVWALRDPALKALAADSVHALAERGVLQAAFTRRLMDTLLPSHPGYYGEMVWIAMMLEQWLRAAAPAWRLEH